MSAKRVELPGYTIRLVGPKDEAQVQALFESDPDYFRLVQGAPPGPAEVKGLLNELPEGKEAADKFVYALFDRDGALAAVIDLLRGYPDDETWYLGLIFVAPVKRGMGLGTGVLDAICTYTKRQGGHALRLGVDRANARARALYERAGFHFAHERVRAYANGFESIIDVLERAL